ncbi:hypothetical protein Acy02nite_14290 [Actinoplanes cyaneus]|uniref:GtrA-like protein domain-containing protein n=1 Tax=Actinoplanes cyaneus TaxID=52696 RepID=A0A919M3U6_9ACTN|nr:GtrA family protein [Actinoplanes cyaneus]MCW2137498.1 GtrA-like protein [Actinoplanes cyaneus]GID63548.1 hypothetical protein Acy02nite_14290 [Actinoplanes cyaneus]
MTRPSAWNATVPRQLVWFMLVGALSTVLQTIVYVSVREVLAATWASWLALLVVTPANTEAHRRITFNVTTTAVGRLHWEAGLTSVVVYLANLAATPWFAGIAGPHPSALTESMILALTGSVIGGVRYVILRGWVFAARRHVAPAPALAPSLEAATTGSSSPATATTGPSCRSLLSGSVPGGSNPGSLVPDGSAPDGSVPGSSFAGRRARRNALRGRALRRRPNAAPASATTGGTGPTPAVTTASADGAAGPAPATTGRGPAPAADASTTRATTDVPAGPEVSVPATAFAPYPSTATITAALACLGTFAPIPTARLCTGQPNAGVLNQRPAGRLRTWHRNRRQHLTARS